nr:immunity protein Tsi6 family protein [Enterobacter cloacae]
MNKQSYTAMDYIENALGAIQERKSIHPSFSLYNVAEKQVTYIRDVLTGKKKIEVNFIR